MDFNSIRASTCLYTEYEKLKTCPHEKNTEINITRQITTGKRSKGISILSKYAPWLEILEA